MFFSRDHHSAEIVGVFHVTRRSTRRESTSRSHSSVGLRLRGSGEFRFGDLSLVAEVGQLLYIPSGLSYTQRTAEEELISVCFLEQGELSDTPELLDVGDDEELRETLLLLYEVWTRRERGYRTQCASLFYRILYLAHLHTEEPREASRSASALLAPAVSYIHGHIREGRVSVAALAELTFVSESYFRRLFRQVYGLSPCRYIRTMRIEMATALLESGECTVSEAAERVGFSDEKYFSREFRHLKGVSPSAYLRRP